jgi:hypothetical protein
MRRILILLMCLNPGAGLFAQHAADHSVLQARIQELGQARTDVAKDSLSGLVKEALRALLDADDAFTAAFDDIKLSRVDAPDGKFRIFTWNVPHADGSHLFEGLLVVKERARRVLFDLRDRTPQIPSPTTVELGPDKWYGAIYYAVVPTAKGGKTYYTLLGWKGHSNIETRKVIDVLSFKGGTPRFGAPLFGDGKLKHQREVFGFSFQASMSLRWDDLNKRIVLDHLSPMRQDLDGQTAFYGPDLSYDAYVWDRDHWSFQRDIDARDEGPKKPWNSPPKDR